MMDEVALDQASLALLPEFFVTLPRKYHSILAPNHLSPPPHEVCHSPDQATHIIVTSVLS